jgi:hypothetical protein
VQLEAKKASRISNKDKRAQRVNQATNGGFGEKNIYLLEV